MAEAELTARLWITEQDIISRMNELGVDNPTRIEIEKVKNSLRNLAAAWASAGLQDMDKIELANILEHTSC